MTEMRVCLNRAIGFAAVAAFALGTAAFGQCDLECPQGASQESEPCGQDTNGGCNMDVPAFEPLAIGEMYCGTAWMDGESRDTDWYEVEITDVPVTLNWVGIAEFDLVLGFIEWNEGQEGTGDCGNITGYLSPFTSTSMCVGSHIEVEITTAGTYWFFVGPQFNDLVDCNEFPEYIVTLTTEPPTGACCLPDDSCVDDLTYDECINSPNNGRYVGDMTPCEFVDCATRPCPTYDGAIVLSDSLDQFTVVPGTGIACAGSETPQYTTDNWYARSYDLDQIPEIAGEDFFYITCVEVAIESNGGSDVPAHCNIYRDTNGGSPTKANVDLMLIGSKDFIIPSGTSAEVFPINFGDPVAFDMNHPTFPNYLVIEMFIEASNPEESGVWPGCNSLGELGPTYIMAPDCGIPTYVTMASIGFPDCHWVNSVVGATTEPGRNIWLDGEAWPPFDAQGNVQPVTDPVGDWMELYPNFASNWTCTGWDDSNEDGVVSECDYLTLITTGEEESNWHVEWIGLTVWVQLLGIPDLYYLEFRGNLENPDFPLGLYHEVHPMFCGDWLAVDYLDANGNQVLDPGDYYTFEVNGGEQEFYEVIGLATDIELLETEAENPCPWDFDGDGDVDTADLLFLLGAWGTPDGDVDGDGDTDTADLLGLLGAWGDCP